MPALTISTDMQRQNQSTRSDSPDRPPISPITPPLAATHLPGDSSTSSTVVPPRPTYTHTQHPSQASSSIPPQPELIDFSSNPDVIALKSAISVLQVQKQRATADIQALSRTKDDAVHNPDEFVKDLLAGKVNTKSSQARGSHDEDDERRTEKKSWTTLPIPQDIVRCPPINWSQYAVVGESLDKLHTEQISRPVQGSPAILSPSGTYEFRGSDQPQQQAEVYIGVAAPYAPGRDKIDKKAKIQR